MLRIHLTRGRIRQIGVRFLKEGKKHKLAWSKGMLKWCISKEKTGLPELEKAGQLNHYLDRPETCISVDNAKVTLLKRNSKIMKRTSLVVQWLGLCALIARDQVQSLVR